MTDNLPPRFRLGNYELLLELASGGMATVYVARQVGAAGFERLVVVKRVHPHLLVNQDFYDMFLDEARVASLIHHPNVVPVVDVVESAGELFLVMNYVDSSTLSGLRMAATKKKGRLPPHIVARIIADTLSGLHAAHEAVDMRGIHLDLVHRDVSPQNIIVGADGISRVIDFGIAKAAHRITETRTGSLKGKYGYMSPEQTKGFELDRRSDLFAVGVVLHEALTGERLFASENEFETMRRIAELQIIDPSTRAPDVPAALDAVVQKALARNRENRFASASEFLDALCQAIVPASPREVAACLDSYVGDRLLERRETLRSVLSGSSEPFTPSQVSNFGVPKAPRSNSNVSERPTAQYTSFAPPRLPSSEPLVPSVAGNTANALPPTNKHQTAWVALLVAGLGLAVLASATFLLQKVATKPVATVGTQAPESSVTAPTTTTSAVPPAPAEVQLVLLADRRIQSIRAPGTKRIEIENKRAKVTLEPWTGTLTIDAVLEGGRTAHATADATGARELMLESTAAPNVTPQQRTRPPPTPGPTKPPDINLAR